VVGAGDLPENCFSSRRVVVTQRPWHLIGINRVDPKQVLTALRRHVENLGYCVLPPDRLVEMINSDFRVLRGHTNSHGATRGRHTSETVQVSRNRACPSPPQVVGGVSRCGHGGRRPRGLCYSCRVSCRSRRRPPGVIEITRVLSRLNGEQTRHENRRYSEATSRYIKYIFNSIETHKSDIFSAQWCDRAWLCPVRCCCLQGTSTKQ
jgi:hypothetical protein